jgi:ABC-type lipoprotein release transport system permease subunit
MITLWLRLPFRFITRHRRRSLAVGLFVAVSTAVLVLLLGATEGINRAMVKNSTRLHYGNFFLEYPPGTENPGEETARIFSGEKVEVILLRYRLSALLSAAESRALATAYAVEPSAEEPVTAIGSRVIAGRYPASGNREILLGQGLAERLEVSVADEVSLVADTGTFVEAFTVSGIFRTGINHIDAATAIFPLAALPGEEALRLGAETSVFTGGGSVGESRRDLLSGRAGAGVVFRTWEELMPDLVQLVELNRVSMGMIAALVFFLVGFGISIIFIMAVVERYHEFGILKALGFTPREIVLLVFLESFLVCFVAAAAGLALGALATSWTGFHGVDLSAYTSHNRYFVAGGIVRPVNTWGGLIKPFVMALVVSLFSSWFPARLAAKRVTVRVLRVL